MSVSTSNPSSRLHVVLICFEEALHGTIHSALDVLRTVAMFNSLQRPNQPYLFSWEIISATCKKVRVPGLVGEKSFPRRQQTGQIDRTLVVVPGLHAHNSHRIGEIVTTHRTVLEYLEKHASAGGWIAGIFTGIAFPAKLGLLNGATIAAPWAHESWFARMFQKIEFADSGPMARHGKIFTCVAPGLQTEFMLAILAAMGYADLANSASQILLFQGRRQQLIHDLIEKQWTARTSDSPVSRAIEWLNNHVDHPYSLKALANVAATSERTLLRHFQQVTGMTPLDYLHDLRVERAKMLLEVTLQTVHMIAQACGYSDVASFRRVFRSITGTTPTEYRSRFALRTRRRHWRAESFA